jgi:iron complex outermembrane receptor protein
VPSRPILLVTAVAVLLGAWSLLPASDGIPEPFYLVDPGGEPLDGVRVSVQGRTGSTVTAEDGGFRLVPEPAPPFRLVVLDEGGRLLGTVDVESDGRVLVMVPASVENVRVLREIAPSTKVPPAAAATTLSREERSRTAPAHLVDVLDEMPGAERSGSGLTAVPSIRGLAGGRTLILLDDARVTAERRAGPSATYLDPFSLENIEIVRGPGSLSYGSDAIGGVIHARTPLPRTGSFSGRYELAAGAGVRTAAAAGEVNVPLGGGALLVQFHQRRFGDYDSPTGRVSNSSARDGGVLVKGMVPLGERRLYVGLQVDRGRDVERPASDLHEKRTVYPREDSERLTLAVDLPGRLGFSRTELRAFVGNYRLVTEQERFSTGGGIESRSRADVDASDASFRIIGDRPVGRGSIRTGLDLKGRFSLHATDSDGGVTIDSARRIDAGLFAEGELPLGEGRTVVSAGLRGDRVHTRNRGGSMGSRSGSEGAASGYAAVRFRPVNAPLEYTVQVARGFRAPRLSDLFFSGTTGRGTITGNPDLKPETSRQLDLAVRADAGPLKIAVFAYLYRIRDLIERYRVADRRYTFRNRGEEEIRGVELDAEYPVADRWSVRTSATWARGEILDDSSAPSDIPYTGLNLSVRHRASDRLWWRAGYRLVAGDDRNGPTELQVPGYGVLDGSLGWSLPRDMELRVRVNNITDREYPASPDESAPPAPGRNAVVVLAGSF